MSRSLNKFSRAFERERDPHWSADLNKRLKNKGQVPKKSANSMFTFDSRIENVFVWYHFEKWIWHLDT